MFLSSRKEAPHNGRTHYSVGPLLDKAVERSEALIVDERYRDVFYHCWFRTTRVGRLPATVHGAGGNGSTVFQPKMRPRGTTGIEQREVFETMQDESSHFKELVIIRGRVLFEFAGSHSLWLLAAANDHK